MSLNRRKFMSFATAMAAAIATDTHAAPPTKPEQTDPRQQERMVIEQMVNAGYPNFVLLSKKDAKLYLIQDGEFFLQTPIIFGRQYGQKNLTPTGVFSLTNLFHGASKPKMVFHVDNNLAYLLHGVVPGREAALDKENVAGRALSDGCVNIDDHILPYVLGFARSKAQSHPQKLATPFVVLDKGETASMFEKHLKNFVPQEYNPD